MEIQDGRVSRLHCILHPEKVTPPEAGGPTVAGGESKHMYRCHVASRAFGWSCMLDVNRLNVSAASF